MRTCSLFCESVADRFFLINLESGFAVRGFCGRHRRFLTRHFSVMPDYLVLSRLNTWVEVPLNTWVEVPELEVPIWEVMLS